jgi:bla regulator protein blaR1
MVSAILTWFSLWALSITGAFAQTSSNGFEVATIKPSDPNTPGITFRNAPGSLDIRGATLGILIEQAYDVRDFQISGGPGWVNSDRYDIMAKTERGNTAPPDPGNLQDPRKQMEQQRERLRALLADRFHLKVRRDTKEMQAYVLTPAKGGPKLKESKVEEPMPAPDGSKAPQRPRGPMIRIGRGQITGQSMPLDFLARLLAQQVGRPVIDKTGLTGAYDLTLEWTPEPVPGAGPGIAPPGELPRSDNPATAESSGTSIFVAIQEQLGLKLESQKTPVEVIVIESVEKPSEN